MCAYCEDVESCVENRRLEMYSGAALQHLDSLQTLNIPAVEHLNLYFVAMMHF